MGEPPFAPTIHHGLTKTVIQSESKGRPSGSPGILFLGLMDINDSSSFLFEPGRRHSEIFDSCIFAQPLQSWVFTNHDLIFLSPKDINSPAFQPSLQQKMPMAFAWYSNIHTICVICINSVRKSEDYQGFRSNLFTRKGF
jgi:hypothetical protein